ncbi:MAG: alkaline phosphatase family protein [Solirubrobacteraceae bacterium]
MAGALAVGACALAAPVSSAALPPIKHVFVIIEENEEVTSTFTNPAEPYFSQTLPSDGVLLRNYYAIGHNSLDNYIAMVSGQAPNALTSGDCPNFDDFSSSDLLAANGQMSGQGCVYPTSVPSLMSQMDAAGLTWKAYEDSMGSAPLREAATCGHPPVGQPDNTQTESASPFDAYATRHDPFMYFHAVIDNAPECNANVVGLSPDLHQLTDDLASAATTPNYVFVTPDLCDDGHDAICANGGAGGLTQAAAYLPPLVSAITSSPAYQQSGLLIITYDEGEGDDSSCCGEFPGPDEVSNGGQPGGSGPGGGVVGAVLLSPFIQSGTESSTPYNHYSMLATVEDIFGLPRLGEAACVAGFGTDVFDQAPGYSAGPAQPSSANCSPAPNNIATTPTPTNPTPTPTPTTPIPTPTPTPVTPAVKVTPADSSLHLSPAALTPGRKPSKGGSLAIVYADSQASLTTFTVSRLVSGYLHGRTCTALKAHHRRPAHTSACTVAVEVGTFTHRDRAGANRIVFDGRLGGRLLAAGSYELQAAPTLAGVHGHVISVRFTVK